MLIEICRRGDGWAGEVGHWIVDTVSNIAIDLNTYRFSKEDNKKPRMISLSFDKMDLLSNYIENGRIKNFGSTYMDIQDDIVRVIGSYPEKILLYTTFDIRPENNEFHDLLYELINYLQGLKRSN